MVLETIEEVLSTIYDLKKDGKTIGFTHGAFDLFHVGHLYLLNESSKLCDVMFVGTERDGSVIKYKGSKPIIPEDERVKIVSSIKNIYSSFLLLKDMDSKDYLDLYKALDIDFISVGRDFSYEKIEDDVKSIGKKFVNVGGYKGNRSTSQIIRKVKRLG